MSFIHIRLLAKKLTTQLCNRDKVKNETVTKLRELMSYTCIYE